MKREILPKLTKKYILERTSQVDIYSKYMMPFNISLTAQLIEYMADTNNLILNPLRNDDTSPSLGFRYNNKGKLKMRDFNGSFWGDCFDLVGYLLKLDANTKRGFAKVLEHIYLSMRLSGNVAIEQPILKISNLEVKNRKLIIEPTMRSWNRADFDLWANSGVSLNTLNADYVYPVDTLLLNKAFNASIVYRYDIRNPAYAYYQGVDKNGITNWIIYYPIKAKRKSKFIQNNQSIQGALTYNPSAVILIITKSTKDILSIKELALRYFPNIKFAVIAPPSEAITIKESTMRMFLKNHKLVATLFDFDMVGIKNANNLKRLYGTLPLFFTDGRFGSYDFKAKDFSEYNNKSNHSNLVEIIEELIEEYKHIING